jgi:NAD(P)-dependent dehydrogenase (short-subunit alcohol dehydrogenase family)
MDSFADNLTFVLYGRIVCWVMTTSLSSQSASRVDDLVTRACERAGLAEFGDNSWREGLHLLVETIESAPGVNPGGRDYVYGQFVDALAYPHTGHYVAAKHGVVGLMRTFAVELGQHNIRVNSVHPTHVSTPMIMNEGTWKMFRPDLENPGPDDMAPICQLFHVLPIPWVDPIDISNAVLFFASDEARYLTGVTLPIDAGSCLK